MFKSTGKSIELLSVLPSSFRLLLTLQAGADIVLSLFDLGDHASLCTAALEPLERILKRLAFLNANFRHRFSLPPMQPASSMLLSGPLHAA